MKRKLKLKIKRMPGGGYESNIVFCSIDRQGNPEDEYRPVTIEPDEDYPRKWRLSGIGNIDTKKEAVTWLTEIVEWIEQFGKFEWARPQDERYAFKIIKRGRRVKGG